MTLSQVKCGDPVLQSLSLIYRTESIIVNSASGVALFSFASLDSLSFDRTVADVSPILRTIKFDVIQYFVGLLLCKFYGFT